jgi:hypothetical protein
VTRHSPLPEFARAMMLDWWKVRAMTLADGLQAALEAGEAQVVIDGPMGPRWASIDQATELAGEALDMVEKMEGRSHS